MGRGRKGLWENLKRVESSLRAGDTWDTDHSTAVPYYRSPVRDLQETVGQFDIYRVVLAETEPERLLYLAVPRRVYETLLAEPFGQLIVTRMHLRLLVFDEQKETVVRWIS